MTVKEIKIGLDFHGVINERPDYFAAFCCEALQKGYEIHIITGGPYDVVREVLAHWGVCYSKIFAIVDFYDAKGEVTRFANGEFKVPEKLWDMAKAEYCAQNGINIHIDDSSLYARWFTTPYCHYDHEQQNCSACNGVKIDFSKNPEVALREIEQLVSSVQVY